MKTRKLQRFFFLSNKNARSKEGKISRKEEEFERAQKLIEMSTRRVYKSLKINLLIAAADFYLLKLNL